MFPLTLGDKKNVLLVAKTPGGEFKVEISPTAHRQLAEKVAIPFDYYERMRVGQPDLLAVNVNRWLASEPNRHLFRMLGPITEEDGRRMTELAATYRLRAVLSPKFRPLDNAALLSTVLPVAAEHGAIVSSFNYGDDRFHLRLVSPDRPTRKAGEIIRVGMSLRNSETGFGALLAEPFAEILRCINGMIVAENYRAIHSGRGKEDGFIQEDTKRLEDAAIFLRMRDKAVELFGEPAFERIEAAIDVGSRNALALPADLPMFEFIGNVAAKFELTVKETEILKEEVVNDLQAARYEVGLNPFAVAQGMTALARRVGEEDFDRRTELERAGWEILTSPVEKLLKAGKAASN